MPRSPLPITEEQRKARRFAQKQQSRAKIRMQNEDKYLLKSALQRWTYRQLHPESYSDELSRRKVQRSIVKSKNKLIRKVKDRQEARKYVWRKVILA